MGTAKIRVPSLQGIILCNRICILLMISATVHKFYCQVNSGSTITTYQRKPQASVLTILSLNFL